MTIRHPSLVASAGTLVVLAAVTIVRPLPWPVWLAWAVLTVVGIRQASRGRA